MQDFQQRVIDEKKELDEKLTKLSEFIEKNPMFWTLDSLERGRLRTQYDAMTIYSNVLGERITAFG